MSDTIRILSIDGGGIRGIIPAMVLQALLGKLKAQDVFHIIAGTSTGGIIACGLAKPNPVEPEQIVNLYVQHGSEIFKQSIWDPIHYVYGPKYNSTALESYLASVLGDVSLSAVENVRLFVPIRYLTSKGKSAGEHVRSDVFPQLAGTRSVGSRRR
jgi:uncharacterized protein